MSYFSEIDLSLQINFLILNIINNEVFKCERKINNYKKFKNEIVQSFIYCFGSNRILFV